jgi:DNA-binding protein YbaB
MDGLIQTAVNDALEKSRKLMAQKIGPLGGGLGGLKF